MSLFKNCYIIIAEKRQVVNCYLVNVKKCVVGLQYMCYKRQVNHGIEENSKQFTHNPTIL